MMGLPDDRDSNGQRLRPDLWPQEEKIKKYVEVSARCYQSFADSILFYCKFMFKDHSIPLYINAMRRRILIINIPEDYKKGGEIRVQESKNSDEN